MFLTLILHCLVLKLVIVAMVIIALLIKHGGFRCTILYFYIAAVAPYSTTWAPSASPARNSMVAPARTWLITAVSILR